VEHGRDNSDSDEEDLIHKNFRTQRELMKMQEDMTPEGVYTDNSHAGRLSTQAVEEIHKLYTEGKPLDKCNGRMVDPGTLHAIRSQTPTNQNLDLDAATFP
jgi:hypothetical protein